jgi:hypothetical protein
MVLSLRPLFISLKRSRSAERIDFCERDRKLESRSLHQRLGRTSSRMGCSVHGPLRSAGGQPASLRLMLAAVSIA